jgi:hypothetical protein
MARVESANDVISQAALEVGLIPIPDPVASSTDEYVQLTGVLTSAGRELVELHAWQALMRPFEVMTAATDTGTYDLPEDFAYMIDQTGWDKSNRVAIGGPLSAQDWSYLEGRDLVSQSIYASFRLVDNKFDLFPQPPPDGLNIRFEYISRYWVQQAGAPAPNQDKIITGSDIVLYDPTLIVKFLKAKFLEAKGFDATSARLEFDHMFNSRTGKDEGAPILNAANNSRGFPYLNMYGNTPDTGYGL